MTSYICLTIALTGSALGTSSQDHQSPIERMVYAKGGEYLELRRSFQAEPDDADLQRSLQSDDPIKRLQAVILSGWIDHREYYLELLKREPRYDRTAQPHYFWWRGHQIRPEAVPLLYELIVKGGAHANAQSDAAVVLARMSRGGTRIKADWMLPLLGDARIQDRQTRRATALLLGRVSAIPQLGADSVLAQLNSEQDPVVSKMLLVAFANSVRTLPEAEQRRHVAAFSDNKTLQAKVGEVAKVRTMGAIGGPVAAEAVCGFLEAKRHDVETKLELLEILSQLNNAKATASVVKYANDEKAEIDLRLRAITLLPDCSYDIIVLDTLTSIAKKTSRSMAERSEAIDALGRVHTRQVDAGNSGNDVKNALLSLDESVKDEKLQRKLRQEIRRVLVRNAP